MVRVHLAGRVAVEVDGAAVPLPPGRATELLAWLAAHPGLHPRSRIAPVFWPDVSDATARASLRTALWALRKALGPAGEAVLTLDRNEVGLTGEGLWVDLRDGEAPALVGPLLPGIDTEWADEVRASYRQSAAAHLAQQGDEAERAGDHRGAVGAARALAALDPFSEECHRLVVRRLADAGERAAAVREHEEFRRRLWDELQLRPSPATRDFVARLTAADADVAPAPAPAVVLPARLERARSEFFVGREDEYQRLREAWAAAERGAGPVVVLACGEPGIGKTCLAARMAAEVFEAGGTVLFGQAVEDELLPAEPFLEAIGEHHSLAPADLVELVRRRVEARAASSPALLVLDDFHWADTVSFAVLRRLARSQAASRLAVLVAYRDDGGVRSRFAALEADLARTDQLVRIELGPLPLDATSSLLAGLDPDGGLPAQAAGIQEDTGGNPLFVHELGRYLLEGGTSVPASVRTLAAARLRGLSPEAVETVLAAAVLGVRVELSVVGQMVRPGVDALGGLEEAASLALIAEEAAGVHVFRHALVRGAVYDGLSKSRRAELHRRAADAIRLVHGDEGRHLCDIAEHRCAAVPPGSPEGAVADAQRAGAWALEHHAYDRAVVVLTKALPFADDGSRRELTVRRAIAFQRLNHSMIDP